ncbi:MAG TPA: PaaI family thioesterase [Burkholderiales bacterium]
MERALSVTWSDPHAAFEEGSKLTPIEHLRAIRDGRIPEPPIARLLGMRLAVVADGTATFELTPAEQHYNPIGAVHGGIAFTLLDSAMGCAVQTRCPAGKGYTTLELKVNLVRAITLQTGPIRASAKIVHFGSRTATAEGRLEDAAGKLYAHGTSTCLILG